MIAEVKRGDIINNVFSFFFRNKDLYTDYIIPPVLDYKMPLKSQSALTLQGPKDDLKVQLEASGKQIWLNTLAPKDTRFAVSGYTPSSMVLTNVDEKKITIPAGKNHRGILPYAVLHAIGRLEVHEEDQEWDSKTREAHLLLNARISHLRAFGKVILPKDSEEQDKELKAWQIVAAEERVASERAVSKLKYLLQNGVNPFPNIKSCEELTNRIVNGSELLRTMQQIVTDPKRTGKQIGIPMTLTPDRVRYLVENYYR